MGGKVVERRRKGLRTFIFTCYIFLSLRLYFLIQNLNKTNSLHESLVSLHKTTYMKMPSQFLVLFRVYWKVHCICCIFGPCILVELCFNIKLPLGSNKDISVLQKYVWHRPNFLPVLESSWYVLPHIKKWREPKWGWLKAYPGPLGVYDPSWPQDRKDFSESKLSLH